MEKSNKKKFRVNWIDGMKINKDHFIAFEGAMVSIINNATQSYITPTNFGLLPDYSKEGSSVDITVSIDGQNSVEVVVNKCNAITLGGHQIEINTETKALLEQSGLVLKKSYTLDSNNDEWYVIISVNPNSRVPVGNADPEEEPPRHPFVLPEYKVDVLPKSELSKEGLGLYHITIGKIVLSNEKPTLVENYIPPCSSIQGHPDLKFIFSQISSFFNHMEAYSLHIIQKIYQKKQTNDLAQMTLILMQNTLQYLNKIISEFRLIDKNKPPIFMINKLTSLARVMKSSLDIYTGTGKENLLNYLTDWCDLNQGAFENVLIDMIDVDYQHTDINLTLEKVEDYTKLMLTLFKKLNELDYIGKKSDSNIFVKEEVVDNVEVKKRRSFLLD
jgi:hypothetical protein